MDRKEKWEVTSIVASIIIGIIAIIGIFQIPTVNDLVKGKNQVDSEILKPYCAEIVNGRDPNTWEGDGITASKRNDKKHIIAKVQCEGYGVEAFFPFELEEKEKDIYIVKVDFDNVKYREFSNKPDQVQMVLLTILMGMVIGYAIYVISYVVPTAISRVKKNNSSKKFTEIE